MWTQEQEDLTNEWVKKFEEATTLEEKLEVYLALPREKNISGAFSRRVSRDDYEKVFIKNAVKEMNNYFNNLPPEEKKLYE